MWFWARPTGLHRGWSWIHTSPGSANVWDLHRKKIQKKLRWTFWDSSHKRNGLTWATAWSTMVATCARRENQNAIAARWETSVRGSDCKDRGEGRGGKMKAEGGRRKG